MKYIIFFLIVLLLMYFMCCFYNCDIEGFDETKIKIAEFAKSKIEEFKYEDYKYYIDKYFKNINPIDLHTIPLRRDGKILCSVASYRDRQCPLTVADMISKAADPTRLVIVVCQQNDPADEDCFDKYDFKGAVIKKIALSDKDARGPCWARCLTRMVLISIRFVIY